MYYTRNEGQISIAQFVFALGKLDPNNRWVRIADMIPWQQFEERYALQFCEDNGAPAIRFRMSMGTLLIKQMTGHSDEETLQDIIENPYMQYLIGLHEFTEEAPFASSSITNFRKYISQEMINEINEMVFRGKQIQEEGTDSDGTDSDDTDTASGEGGAANEAASKVEPAQSCTRGNEGTLMIDATCAPAYIAYPTDINLLNEAREKLEAIIDTLHPHTGDTLKPRTYRIEARKRYLRYAKQRRVRKGTVYKAIGQQLRYVARDLRHIESQLQKAAIEVLSNAQRQWYDVIKTLYAQQKQMHEQHTHRGDKRVVSISQPHVRPIVRGKVNTPAQFGAKVTVSLVDGYAYIEKLGWEAYNEESQLKTAIEKYMSINGHYPERVLVDKLFRNRINRAYCKERGIRISGPRLGRPPKEKDRAVLALERKDSADRNAIEGKFGQGKAKYGLDRVMARLKHSCETVIAMSFLCMNLRRRLRLLFLFFRTRFVLYFLHFSTPFLYPHEISSVN